MKTFLALLKSIKKENKSFSSMINTNNQNGNFNDNKNNKNLLSHGTT